ncbi:MAG: right-handed parallel beta-helix repeat-containing protein [Pseudomonadota bacterium]
MNPFFGIFGMLFAVAGLGGAAGGEERKTTSAADPTPPDEPTPDVPDDPTPPVEPTPDVPDDPTPPVEPTPDVADDPTPPVEPTPDVADDPTPPVEPTPDVADDPTPPVEPTPDVADDPTPPVEPTPDVADDPTPPDEPAPDVADDPTPPVEPTPDVPDDDAVRAETTEVLPTGGSAEVFGGRVTTFAPEDDSITEIRILSDVEHGNLTVNPDNSLALVMTTSDFSGTQSFTYEATHADGSTTTHDVSLNVVDGPQAGGWGTGDFYMLRADENDDVIVEHGDIHRDVFISGSDDALTLEDIAALEDITVEEMGDQWWKWLEEHPEYGGSADMAVTPEVGMQIWFEITAGQETSHWLQFERGYEYDNLNSLQYNDPTGRLTPAEASGESELHPLHITAYGEGSDPVLNVTAYQSESSNIVFSGVRLENGSQINFESQNILYDDVSFGGELLVQNSEAVTIRNSDITDVVHDEPVDGGDTWVSSDNRLSGLYSWNTNGLLVENTLFDHNGWAADYDYDLSADDGQPPSSLSHNIYIQYQMHDVTLRDNIIMRGASFGAQVRSGGFLEDNVFIDNNASFSVLGGDWQDRGPISDYSLVNGNVTTSAGYKEVAERQGATSWGIVDSGELSTMVDNLVVHLADPNNPEELEYKLYDGPAYQESGNAFYDDTIVYGWYGQLRGQGDTSQDLNTDGVDPTVADQTTIQAFIQDYLDDPDAGISDLADLLRAQADGELDDVVDADLIIDFFHIGFGIIPDGIRADAETLRFVPDELGEGVRWDNRLNWSTEDLPGTQDGDSVDLGGNWVTYSAQTTMLQNLETGDGGELRITGGYLEIEGDLTTSGDGGEINIDRAGQFWINGYSDTDAIDINVEGGRFANTGDMSGDADITIGDNAQAILATGGATYDQGAGNRLEINGGDAKVGFDGSDGAAGTIRLHDEGTLAFTAEDDDIGSIEEFRSGAFDDAPDVASNLDLGGATLELDVTALTGSNYDLARVDEIIGTFGDVNVIGLGDRDAEIVIDYEADIVTLNISAGEGLVNVVTAGADPASAGPDELWAALTDGHGVFEDADDDFEEDDLDAAEDLLDAA